MRLALLPASLLLAAACDSPPKLDPACHTSIERGQSLLAVPDVGAARDWLAQAKRQCGGAPPAELAQLEQDILATERRQAEVAEKKRRDAEPKPASESLVPKLVEVVARYRDAKGREKCSADDERCNAHENLGGQTVQLWTLPGKRDTFLAFTTLKKELATCEQLGPSQVTKTFDDAGKVYCKLTGGALAGLFAIVKQEKSRVETDVTIFSAKAADADETLRAEIATGRQSAAPP
jgi:hypothetical protein